MKINTLHSNKVIQTLLRKAGGTCRVLSMLALLLAITFAAKANPVDVNEARQVGATFLNANVPTRGNITTLDHVITYSTSDNTPAFYVFNAYKSFVIVAADDCATPILGYSTSGQFDPDNLPVQLQDYLQDFVNEIQYAYDRHMIGNSTTAQQWSMVRITGKVNLNRDTQSVAPLLTDSWGQGCHYNNHCPEDTAGYCGRVVTGCVATSMSEIMRYWGHPVQGNGSHSYTPEGYPTQTANFGATTYDWANMPNSLNDNSTTAQVEAISTLVWHCGVAVEMMYGAHGSGAYSEDVVTALKNYFDYSQSAHSIYRNNMSDEAWLTAIKGNLDLGKPVHHSGSNSEGGHAFVCDGYDENDFLHFNFGWYGSANGYFAVGAVLGEDGYNNYNHAIIDIVPNCQAGTYYQVNVSASPSEGGGIMGAGTYECGSGCTLTATPNDGYTFCSWTENGAIVSTDPTYSFTVMDDRTFEANFMVSDGDECTLVFTFNDSYGDGWNGNYLVVNYSEGCFTSENLTLGEGATGTVVRNVPSGSHVILSWYMGQYTDECSFSVGYQNSEAFYSASNLSSGFSYEFDVNCDSGSGGDQQTIIEQGFEDGLGDWTLNHCHASSGVSSAYTPHSGSYAFRFYYTSNYPQYLISPEFDEENGGGNITFYVASYSASYPETYKVGYSFTTNDPSEFTWYDEVTCTTVYTTGYDEVSYDLPAGVKFVSIACTSNDQFYLFVDDITVTLEEPAPAPTPGEIVDVTIGDPTSTTTNANLPGYSLYDYAISQQIYTADEIGTAGTINSLTMWLKNSSSYARNYNIYMKEVTDATFESNTAWVSMSDSDLVATATLNNGISDPTETTFTLSTPFEYSGNGNLLICIADVTGNWSGGVAGVIMDASGNQAIYAYRDGSAYDVTAPGVNGTLLAKKNVVKLNITTGHNDDIVTIGSGTDSQFQLPVQSDWLYSLSEQIYTAEEIGRAGTISTIGFKYDYDQPFTVQASFALKHVTKEFFEASNDMVNLSDDDFVYSGTFSATTPGWVTLVLDTPFEYDGTSNLLVACYKTEEVTYGSNYKFKCTYYEEGSRALGYYNSSIIPDYTDLAGYGGWKQPYNYRNDIQLGFGEVPIVLSAPQAWIDFDYMLEYEENYLNWNMPNEDVLLYNIYQDDILVASTTDTYYDLTNLTYNLDGYRFNVTAVYEAGESYYSNDIWVYVTGKGTIAGHVYEQDGVTPIQGAMVRFDGTGELGGSYWYYWYPGEEGYYSFEMPVGVYTGYAIAPGYQQTYYVGDIVISHNETTTIDFVIDEAFYSVAEVTAEYYPDANDDESDAVKISWTWGEAQEGWHTYLESEFNNAYRSNVGTCSWGYEYPVNMMSLYAGYSLTKVALFSDDMYSAVGGNYTCNVYLGGVTPDIATLVSSITVDVPVGLGEWVEYDLTAPVAIDGTQPLWIIWTANETAGLGYPAGCSNYSSEYGDWWNNGRDSWYHMGSCWTMRNYFSGNGRDVVLNPNDIIVDYNFGFGTHADAMSDATNETECVNPNAQSARSGDRSLQYYRVYRTDEYNEGPFTDANTVLVADNVTDTYYIDESWAEAPTGSYKYGVSCVYEGNRETAISWANNEHNNNNVPSMAPQLYHGNNRELVTLLDEDFENGAMPQGWTSGGESTWQVGTGDYSTSTGAYEGDFNVKCTHSNTGNMTYLQLPVIDLSGASQATLSFAFINRSWSGDTDGFGVYYSNAGVWNELYYTTEAHGSWTEISIPLVNLTDNYQIGFRMDDNYGYGVGLDKIVVTAIIDAPIPSIQGERESEIVWSNTMEKGTMLTDGDVNITVTLNDGRSPAGTIVNFYNQDDVTQMNHPMAEVVLDETGYYAWESFRKGNYYLEVYKEGYYYIWEQVSIYEPTDLEYVLSEVVEYVSDLYVSSTGWAMWNGLGNNLEVLGGATIVLNVPGDPWNDGTGYQLLLDADHNTYGGTIPTNGNFTATDFNDFEYTIPENAECSTTTSTIVIDDSQSIVIPAGTYDYVFLNPYPGGTYWIAGNNGNMPGRGDDFVFEAGKTYTFTIFVNGGDGINLVVTDGSRNPVNLGNRQFEACEVELTDASGMVLYSGTTDNNYMQLPVDDLVEGETYGLTVSNVYTSGTISESVLWTYQPCDNYDGATELYGSTTDEGNLISWSYPEIEGTTTNEVQVGNGNGVVLEGPVYDGSNYSLMQQLYLASNMTEAGMSSGTIKRIGYRAVGNMSHSFNDHVRIWMANVSETEQTNASADVNTMTLVYDDDFTIDAGWNMFELNGNFDWDGMSNLLVVVAKEGTAAADSETASWWYIHSSGYYATSWFTNNDNAYSPETTSYYMNRGQNLLNTTFVVESEAQGTIGALLYRDGELLGLVNGNEYLDEGVTDEHEYSIRVVYGGTKICPDQNIYFSMSCPQIVGDAPATYQITASVSPEDAGTVEGAGLYTEGAQCTLVATANDGYTFSNWTKDGTIVSNNPTFAFTVTEDAAYVANFISSGNYWEVDENAYANTMSVIGVIVIDSEEQFRTDLEVGVFCGDECRGTQRPTDEYFEYVPHYLMFLTVHGNTNDELTFRVYDHSLNQELELECLTATTFIADETLGDPGEPFEIAFSSNIEITQATNFGQGWNWWSSYVVADDLMAQMKTGLGADGKQIKSQSKFTMNYGTMWMGQLNSLENDQTYMIQANNACSVELTGAPVNPADYPITLTTGWKWIGYPCTESMSVSEALAGITPTAGDQIKAQNNFATYYNNIGWMGSLRTLTPGAGYMYKLNGTSQTLVFPNGGRGELAENVIAEGNHWTPEVHAYPSNMTVMAVVELEGTELRSESYELAAFANGEVRGSAKLMYVEPLDRYMAFLTIAGDEAAELRFGLYDGMDEYLDSDDFIVYATDAIVGTPDAPMVVRFRGTTGLSDIEHNLHVYPNPANGGERFSVSVPAGNNVRVEVVNALGVVVETYQGASAPASVTAPMTAGVYTLRITVDGKGTYSRKLVVK